MAVNHEKKAQLIEDLVASITHEDRTFDMSAWVTDEDAPGPATCGTASCLAGHLAAIRPELAARLAPQYETERDDGSPTAFVNHASLSRAIYCAETGEITCPLDFMARNYPGLLAEIDVDDAIEHVRGTSEVWPLLTGFER